VKIILEPIIAPASFEEKLEEELVAWFEKNLFVPLQAAFAEDRMNATDDWYEFPEMLESLGYSRSEMPQIRADDREALVSFLAAQGIGYVTEIALPNAYRPTQELYSGEKLKKAREHAGGERALLVASDRRILDGHHQWFARYLDHPFDTVEALVFDSRIPRLIREANRFPAVERENAVRNNAVPDLAELIAALNSGRISYAEGVFSGRFSAILSKSLRSIGAKYEKASKTYRIEQGDLPYNIRGAIAASKARAAAINRKLLDAAADVAASVAAAPSLGLKLEKFTTELVGNLEEQFVESVAAAGNDVPAIEFVATPPDFTPAMIADVRETLTENLTLSIKTFTDAEVVRIRELAEENWNAGGRVDLIERIVEERFDVTRRKARFLARQETSMVASEFARARAQEIGSTEYVWHTRHDDRVRHDHQELNGTTQSWDDPPIVDKSRDRRANPGMDFGCRCVAQPILNLAARRVA
jgi:SPP1 gp7 family putative phage head morphogenesis protein